MKRRIKGSTGERRRLFRLSARSRLTLTFGGMFILASMLLLVLNYTLLEDSLNGNRDEVRAAFVRRLEELPATPPLGAGLPPAPGGNTRVAEVYREVQRDITNAHLNQLLTESAIALSVMGVVSMVLGYLIAGRVLRPVKEMTLLARQLSDSTLHERIDLDGPQDEIRELADTFDSMLDRLEAAFESQRRFVADASHELRTPLAIMRAETDVALGDPNASVEDMREMAVVVRDATARSEHLVESLLMLARTDTARPGDEALNLAETSEHLIESLERRAAERGLRFICDLEPARVSGDPILMERLIGNLLENALNHNVDDGWIEVQCSSDDTTATLTISNSGPKIDDDEVDLLVRRFHRADRTSTSAGVGLGLAIVDSIVRLHRGQLRLIPRRAGGLTVQVTLPAVRALAPSSGRSGVAAASGQAEK